LWLAWIAFIVYGSLLPFDFSPMPLEQAWLKFQATPFFDLGMDQRADWVANGVLYVPAGWLTTLVFLGAQRRLGTIVVAMAAFALCLALAVSVEFTQLFFPARTVSLNDLWAEGIGSALGVFGAATLGQGWPRAPRTSTSHLPWRWRHRLLEVYLLAYVAYCLFPYDVLLSADELRGKLASGHWGWFLAHGDAGVWRVVLQLVAETVLAVPFGVWMARRAATRHRRVRAIVTVGAGLALGLAIEAAQLFIASGTTQGASVLTRGLAVWLGAALWERRERAPLALASLQHPQILWPLWVFYVVALGVVNGGLTAAWHGATQARESLASLRFMPFYYHYYTTEALALLSLGNVALMYAPTGALVWLGHGTSSAAAVIGWCLAATVEVGKLFIEGARPDPTNPWIAAASAWLLHRGMSALARRARGTVVPSNQPAAGTPPMPPAMAWQRALWLALVAYGVIAAISFPAGSGLLAVLLVLSASLVRWRPVLAPAVLLAAWPVLDLAPWSGRVYWDEFDLLLTICTGTVLLAVPAPAGRGKSDPLFRVALAWLLAAFAISTVRALWPLHAPSDNTFYGYFSPYNALRIIKGAAWAVITIVVLRRLARRGCDIGGAIVGGTSAGLAMAVIVIVWERWLFAGVLALSSDYRITGAFSSMHTGGAYIECFLAMAIPFAMAQAIAARRRVLRAIAAVLVLAAGAATMLTYARNGWVALLVALLVFLGLSWRHAGRSGRLAATVCAMAMASAVIALPIVMGPFGRHRLAHTVDDFEARRAHWSDALAMRDHDLGTLWFGMGVGRFPETHYWRSREPERAANFGLGREAGQRYLRLGTGSPLYIEQIVSAKHGVAYALHLRMRSEQPPSELTVSLCEKWLLTSARCSSARFEPTRRGSWEDVQARLRLDADPADSRARWLPLKLALSAGPRGAAIDVDDVRLDAPDGRNLLRNGGFESRLDRWFFTVDVDPPWHIHSLPISVLFDQGWFGAVAWAAFLVVSLGRGVTLSRAVSLAPGGLARMASVAALAAFVTSGVLNTLIDAPRLLWFVLVAAWVATAPQERSEDPAPRGPTPVLG
jgi:VanZ family protein